MKNIRKRKVGLKYLAVMNTVFACASYGQVVKPAVMTPASLSSGGQSGNGGGPESLELQKTYFLVIAQLKEMQKQTLMDLPEYAPLKAIDPQVLLDIANQVSISQTTEKLTDPDLPAGSDVTILSGSIPRAFSVVNSDSWKAIQNPSKRNGLAFHELLRIAKIEPKSGDYHVSGLFSLFDETLITCYSSDHSNFVMSFTESGPHSFDLDTIVHATFDGKNYEEYSASRYGSLNPKTIRFEFYEAKDLASHAFMMRVVRATTKDYYPSTWTLRNYALKGKQEFEVSCYYNKSHFRGFWRGFW